MYVVPGASPLFGLNALGGAIAIDTKNGFANPGTRAELTAGSFDRVAAQAETGGTLGDGVGYFLTASHLEEDGWRDYSPSDATQAFGKLSIATATTNVDVSLTLADTDLIGNGAVPADLLEIEPEAIFTRPDRTQNTLAMLNVKASEHFSDSVTLTGNIYVRDSDIETLNGDDSDFEECENTPGFICEEEEGGEELVLDEDGEPIEADDELEGATVNRTSTDQATKGFGLQADWTLGGTRITLGLAHDESSVEFEASTELGALDDTRLAVPGGAFVGEAFTGLHTSTANTGLYLSALWSLGDAVALTVAGRYNRTNVELEDQLGEDLSGDHEFERFNPSIGFTARAADAMTFYASYSEANRAPSPVELTCADEDDPCRLPNAFVADPPLEQVVAKTFETGVRGDWTAGQWNASVFRTTNDDDILFISAGALTNEGFFDNVGETRREGIELGASGNAGPRAAWFASYTTLDATFRESFAVASPNNPEQQNGEIPVEPGDRLPLVPESLLKGGIRFALNDRWSVGGDVLSSSGAHYRGDEGNLVEEIDGYTILNLRATLRVGAHAELFVNVDNVLDEEYATFGVFGEADEVLGDDFEDPRFLSPGAPRAAWVGLRLTF
jgi:outer membrane receptor protein involved in Fe transport